MTFHRLIFCLVLALSIIGCSRGPDTATLQSQVQSRLDSQFSQGLFRVVDLKRQGSASVRDTASGEDRLLLYFNTRLELLQDYNMADWEGLNAASLAQVLGAAEQGITGLELQGNSRGDELLVHGTMAYTDQDGQWQPVGFRTGGVSESPPLDNTAPPTEITQLLDQIGQVSADARGGEGRDRVVEDELKRAVRNIRLRIDDLDQVTTLASGQPPGAYYALGQAIQAAISSDTLPLDSFESAGSVENCSLIDNGLIDVALVQNDIAAMAYQGQGLFQGSGPLENLRALASLYPEPIQIVTLASSDIRTLEDLRGGTVAVGAPQSGTRVNALQVLGAAGLTAGDLEMRETGLAESIEDLKSGAIDAFFITLAAPADPLQALAAGQPIRLLSIDAQVSQTLLEDFPHYVPLRLPANTYPGQEEAVDTLSVTAMLVANADWPADQAAALLTALFDNVDAISRHSPQAAAISRQSAGRGLSIPLHPGVEGFYPQM